MAYSQVYSPFSNDIEGILPVTKTSFSRWQAWKLPGKGTARDSCGEFFWKGCLELDKHQHTEHKGKIYRRACRRSCGRAQCPVCYQKWAALEGHRAVRRMAQFRTTLKPIHVIVSPGASDIEKPYDDLKDKMYSLVKKVGIIGGMAIIHPFRSICDVCQKDKERCNCGDLQKLQWYVSPHFHLICYGWVNGSAVGSVFENEGWVIKNLGVRETVAGTITYQLSHAGVHMPDNQVSCSVHGKDADACKLANAYPFPNPPDCVISEHEGKKATIVWFGALSYNKLKVDKSVMEHKDVCPICESELKEITFTKYNAIFDDVLEHSEFFDDPDGWEYLVPPEPPEYSHKPAEWSEFAWQTGHSGA